MRFGIAVLHVWSVLVIFFTSLFLAPHASSGGLLVQHPIDDQILAANHVRLETPGGAHWRRIRLGYRLAAGESLSVVIDRHGDDFEVLRLSRNSSSASGILRFESARVVERVPLGFEAGVAGHLLLERGAAGVQISLQGRPVVTPIVVPAGPGDLELAMSPPFSTRLHQRAWLEEVELSDGRQLPVGPTWGERLLAPASPLWLAIAVMAALRLTRGERPWLTRWFPHHERWKPRQISGFLLWVTLLVVGIAFGMGSATSGSAPVSSHAKSGFRLVIAVVEIACGGFLATREALLRRHPKSRDEPWMDGAWLVPLHLGSTLAVGLFVGLVLSRMPRPTAAPPVDSGGGRVRVACYGGSSTQGSPFPQDYPHTYPIELAALLKRRIDPSAVVWNLGMMGKGVEAIDERLPADLARLAPSHVVLYVGGNDVGLDLERFRDTTARIVARARAANARVLLVAEQYFDSSDENEHYARLARLHQVLAEVARREGVSFLDPTPLFHERRDEFLFMDGQVHLTRYGFDVLADVVADALIKG